METMSYNKIKKKRKSYGVYAYFLFIILGTTLVAYSIINEPKPTVLGEDPLKNVEIYEENDIAKEVSSQNTVNLDAITFNVGTTTKLMFVLTSAPEMLLFAFPFATTCTLYFPESSNSSLKFSTVPV